MSMKGEIIRSSMIHSPGKASLNPEWNCQSLGKKKKKKMEQERISSAKTNLECILG